VITMITSASRREITIDETVIEKLINYYVEHPSEKPKNIGFVEKCIDLKRVIGNAVKVEKEAFELTWEQAQRKIDELPMEEEIERPISKAPDSTLKRGYRSPVEVSSSDFQPERSELLPASIVPYR